MNEEYQRGWNDAIRAAADAVHQAPVFPEDSELLIDLHLMETVHTCRVVIESLVTDGNNSPKNNCR